MEDQKQKPSLLYEDDHVFLTNENELFLKKDEHSKARKVCKLPEEKVDDKIAELRNNFEQLAEQSKRLLQKNTAGKEELDNLIDSIEESFCIGDTDALIERLESYRSSIDETAEDNAAEEPAENKEDLTEQAEAKQEEGKEHHPEERAEGGRDPEAYYRTIVKKAQKLAKQTDWSRIPDKFDDLSRKWSDGPEAEEEAMKKLYQKFTRTVENFEKRKEEHYEEVNKQKQKNFETKKRLLEEFEGIISNETWTATKRVGQMKRQWDHTGSMPPGRGEGFDARFKELLNTFNAHKVDRLVQQRQKREDNLMIKLAILEKMERINEQIDHETENWDEIDETFDQLTKQWKKVGRVPKEKANNAWERYKSAQDSFYDLKYRYNPAHQSKVDKFSSKKENIIEEAEALTEAEDIAIAARKINKLHRRWKKIGNLPQRLEDELWNRFKAATDAFNEKKAKNKDKIKEQEEQHYQKKLDLIDQANSIKDTDDFDKGNSQMQSLMNRWKAVDPVARKKSNKIWKWFKGAMDEFYDRSREHFKEVKEERKENLEEKKELLGKLHDLGQHEDSIEAVNIAKGVQEEFKNVGYVPIKQKNKMWKLYREACDVIYDRFRAAKSGDKFDQELAKADLDVEDRNEIQKLRKEYKRVKKEAREIEKEILQFEEKKTYFKPTSGGNSLLDEVENRIQKAEAKLNQKENKMDALTEEMDDIRGSQNE